VAVDALTLTIRIASFGLLIAGLETFAARSIFSAGHPMARSVVSLLHRRPLPRLWDHALYLLLTTQIIWAAWLAAMGPTGPAGALALVALFATVLLVQWRRTLGGDGAEQMGLLIVLAGIVAFVPDSSERVARLAALFLVAQLSLSYFTAGVVKLVSPLWRAQPILAEILGTHRFGSPGIARYLRKHVRLCLLAQWGVIVFEISFPTAILLPLPVLLVLLAAGLTFHFACGILMGLNTFVWAFPAIYPCLYMVWSVWSPFR
jgi:hypothetical protein